MINGTDPGSGIMTPEQELALKDTYDIAIRSIRAKKLPVYSKRKGINENYEDVIRYDLVPHDFLVWAHGKDIIKPAALIKVTEKLTREGDIKRNDSPHLENWGQLTLRFFSESEFQDSVDVVIKGFKSKQTYRELGFTDTRKRNVPNKLWITLRSFAIEKGQINWEDRTDESVKNRLKKDINRINKIFCKYFHMKDNPFKRYSRKNGYEAKFNISLISSP